MPGLCTGCQPCATNQPGTATATHLIAQLPHSFPTAAPQLPCSFLAAPLQLAKRSPTAPLQLRHSTHTPHVAPVLMRGHLPPWHSGLTCSSASGLSRFSKQQGCTMCAPIDAHSYRLTLHVPGVCNWAITASVQLAGHVLLACQVPQTMLS